MASNDGYVSDRNVTQQRIEIEEKVQNDDSLTEVYSSTALNTNDLDDFIKTLSYDEIVSSIEIVKQLQQALIDADKSEIEEKCAGNHTDVKQEKESESVLDSLPDECVMNQVYALNNTDIIQEKLTESALDKHHDECLKNEALHLQSISRHFKTDSENINEDRDIENSVESSNNQVLNILSDFLRLLPWDTESSAGSSPFKYKAVESTSHLNQENLDAKGYKVSHKVYRNDNQEFEGAGFSYSKGTVFNFAEINQETNQSNLLATTAPSGNDDSIIKGECNEEDSDGLYSNNVETNCQGPLIASAVKGELNEWRREYNLRSKSYKKESFQQKQRVKTESRRKRKTENSFSGLEDGTRTHRRVRLFSCKLCEKKIFSRYDLTVHIKTHSGEKPFKYNVCGYKGTQNCSLKIHTGTHTEKKPFEKKLCADEYSMRGNVRIHMKTDTEDEPFACELCGYKCIHQGYLKKHMRTHTGDKPFECGICGYKFSESGSLKRHMRIHTGEKPFKCEFCSYQCTQNGNLKNHMRIHTGDKPFTCELCSYKCNQNSNLKKHMRIHKGDKPFKF